VDIRRPEPSIQKLGGTRINGNCPVSKEAEVRQLPRERPLEFKLLKDPEGIQRHESHRRCDRRYRSDTAEAATLDLRGDTTRISTPEGADLG
jgi:hypothetical protein